MMPVILRRGVFCPTKDMCTHVSATSARYFSPNHVGTGRPSAVRRRGKYRAAVFVILTPCHLSWSEYFAKRSTHAVEGSLSASAAAWWRSNNRPKNNFVSPRRGTRTSEEKTTYKAFDPAAYLDNDAGHRRVSFGDCGRPEPRCIRDRARRRSQSARHGADRQFLRSPRLTRLSNSWT